MELAGIGEIQSLMVACLKMAKAAIARSLVEDGLNEKPHQVAIAHLAATLFAKSSPPTTDERFALIRWGGEQPEDF